eukprot:763097-Pelagomonas_calceolata.AAC.1
MRHFISGLAVIGTIAHQLMSADKHCHAFTEHGMVLPQYTEAMLFSNKNGNLHWIRGGVVSFCVANLQPAGDARTVLQHHLGQEPAAAQICSQALCSSSSLPRDSASGAQHGAHPTSASGAQHGAHPTPEGAPSFLAALLGPRLEAAALKRTLEGSGIGNNDMAGGTGVPSPSTGLGLQCFCMLAFRHASDFPCAIK